MNNASLVALLPHVIQNFVFPLASVNGFNTENVFSILLFPSPIGFLNHGFRQYCYYGICSINGDFRIVTHQHHYNVVVLLIKTCSFYEGSIITTGLKEKSTF